MRITNLSIYTHCVDYLGYLILIIQLELEYSNHTIWAENIGCMSCVSLKE